MTPLTPLREIPQNSGWKKGDTLVVFGEVFARGYVNGLIEEAERLGMNIIYSTVGRRDDDLKLRPLNPQELSEKPQNLINVPLEAGFDLQPNREGRRPVDALEGLKLSEWQSAKMDWEVVNECRETGRRDFQKRLEQWVQKLKAILPAQGNILIAHTMAGGVPRAKIVMPATNRVFKGFGDRYASSEEFWQSDLGRFNAMSFMDVTANTLQDLIDATQGLREERKNSGAQIAYVAYGYHGTEVLLENNYHWQSYSPYLQGFAKIELENIATRAYQKGVNVSVYNAPEILTNSSSIFLGVEVSLYPLLGALVKEGGDKPQVQRIVDSCLGKLKEGENLKTIMDYTARYFKSETIQKWSQFPKWPQHNGAEQMTLMREASSHLIQTHKDTKDLMTSELSEVVFKACGQLMLANSWQTPKPVWWIGHDIVAKRTAQ